jgi:SMC interacting uncharacterized protein involved in chromosome segregation
MNVKQLKIGTAKLRKEVQSESIKALKLVDEFMITFQKLDELAKKIGNNPTLVNRGLKIGCSLSITPEKNNRSKILFVIRANMPSPIID